MTATANPLAAFDDAPMHSVQIRAVAVAALLCALDGFDVLAAAFAAPAISKDWGLPAAMIGWMLSAGLIGMAVGALGLAPFADRVGRRPMILGTLVLIATGMLISAAAPSIEWLIALRVVTGIGIGAMIAIVVPLGAEYANARRRPLAVALTAVAYPLGGTVGGFASAALLTTFPWQSIFVVGGIASFALLPVAALWLPEPLAFLLTRRDPDTLQRVNAYLERCRRAPLAALPPAVARPRSAYASLFACSQRPVTLGITLVNLLCVTLVYFFVSWLPQMVATAGFSASQGTVVSAFANLAGAIGGILIGFAAARVGIRQATAAAMICFGLSVAGFGAVPAVFAWLMAAAIVAGFFQIATMSGVYAIIATTFSADMRATGTGFVTGIGRAASAIAPALAGILLGDGVSRAVVCVLFGGLAIVAAAITFFYLGRTSSRYE